MKFAEFLELRAGAVAAGCFDVVARLDDCRAFGAGAFLASLPCAPASRQHNPFALRADHWRVAMRSFIGLPAPGATTVTMCRKCNNQLDHGHGHVGCGAGSATSALTRAATHSSTCKKGGFKTARHDAIAAVLCSMYRAIGGVCEADHEYGKRAEGDAAARKKANPCTLPSNAKVDVVFYGLADGDQDLYIDVRVACAESHEVGFKEAIAAAEKIKTDKYAREVAGISQSAFLPFVVGSHGGFGTCAKQVWALLVQRAKLVAARDWRQSWSAMTYQQVWLRRLSVAIAKQEAIATLVRVPLVTRQAAMGVAVFGEGEGGEGGGAGYAGVRVAAPGSGGC